MASCPITSWEIDGETVETVSDFIFVGGQNTGVSALASFLPKNTQDRSPLEWTGWKLY